jgi:hypothetical protein
MRITRRATLAGLLLARPAFAAAPVRGVIELFTSQGCSSCPPADRLAAELARDPSLVVLSLPVDYWDNLGWKDTFARHEFTERQVAYARARGDGEVYTPQAVVNGVAHAVGSDRAGIFALLGPLPVAIAIERGADGVFVTTSGGMVLAAPFLRSRDVAIGRGENARARVTYTNIVQRLIPLSAGADGRFAVPDAVIDADAGLAVLVQQGTRDAPGRILGAAIV